MRRELPASLAAPGNKFVVGDLGVCMAQVMLECGVRCIGVSPKPTVDLIAGAVLDLQRGVLNPMGVQVRHMRRGRQTEEFMASPLPGRAEEGSLCRVAVSLDGDSGLSPLVARLLSREVVHSTVLITSDESVGVAAFSPVIVPADGAALGSVLESAFRRSAKSKRPTLVIMPPWMREVRLTVAPQPFGSRAQEDELDESIEAPASGGVQRPAAMPPQDLPDWAVELAGINGAGKSGRSRSVRSQAAMAALTLLQGEIGVPVRSNQVLPIYSVAGLQPFAVLNSASCELLASGALTSAGVRVVVVVDGVTPALQDAAATAGAMIESVSANTSPANAASAIAAAINTAFPSGAPRVIALVESTVLPSLTKVEIGFDPEQLGSDTLATSPVPIDCVDWQTSTAAQGVAAEIVDINSAAASASLNGLSELTSAWYTIERRRPNSGNGVLARLARFGWRLRMRCVRMISGGSYA